jgi:hypothetical protein
MSRFRSLSLILLVIFSGLTWAQDAEPVKKTHLSIKKHVVRPKGFRSLNYTTASLSYFSWGEAVTLAQGGQVDHAHANRLGNALSVDWEHYFKPRFGVDIMGSFLFGVADVGGTQSVLSYNLVNQSWTGFGGAVHGAYRFSKWVVGTLGPIAIYRNLSLPQDPSGTIATSGHSTNLGATVALKMRLNDWLEVREEIGTFFGNPSTYWSVGLGYKM